MRRCRPGAAYRRMRDTRWRLWLVALSVAPLLGGCTAGVIAMQAVPVGIGGVAMANAEDRSPFSTRVPGSRGAGERNLALLDAHIRQAHCGNPASQYWLASALKNRFNTEPNNIEIYKWYRLAEMGEVAAASEELDALAETMAPADVSEARLRAEAWRPAGDGCEGGG